MYIKELIFFNQRLGRWSLTETSGGAVAPISARGMTHQRVDMLYCPDTQSQLWANSRTMGGQ